MEINVSHLYIFNLEAMAPDDTSYFIEAGHKLFTKIETLDIPFIVL